MSGLDMLTLSKHFSELMDVKHVQHTDTWNFADFLKQQSC